MSESKEYLVEFKGHVSVKAMSISEAREQAWANLPPGGYGFQLGEVEVVNDQGELESVSSELDPDQFEAFLAQSNGMKTISPMQTATEFRESYPEIFEQFRQEYNSDVHR